MKRFLAFVVLNCLFLSPSYAHGPTRQSIEESIVINAPVDKVWAMVGDLSNMAKWNPVVDSVKAEGPNTRIVKFAPDKYITLWVIKRDEEKMMIKYKITDMTAIETFEFSGRTIERPVLPVNNYTGIITVTAEGEASKVSWRGKFYRPYVFNPPTPEGMSDKDAVKTITSFYRDGLDYLKSILEKQEADVAEAVQLAEKAAKDPASVASSGAAPPYEGHLQCEEGNPCKIDTFLLKGFRAFSQCQVCHGIDGNGSTIAPSLLEKVKKEVTYDVFINRVTNGFKGQIGVMPSWKENPNIMKNVENLYAYLKARSDGKIPAGRLKKFKN